MTTWHEVVVDGLTYSFRDRETAERFRAVVDGEAAAPPVEQVVNPEEEEKAEILRRAFEEDVERRGIL